MTDCSLLGNTAALPEIFFCAIQLASGQSILLATILVFCVFVYAMYKFKMPWQLAAIFGFFLTFLFSGAGDLSNAFGGLGVFNALIILMISAIGVLIVFALYKVGRR